MIIPPAVWTIAALLAGTASHHAFASSTSAADLAQESRHSAVWRWGWGGRKQTVCYLRAGNWWPAGAGEEKRRDGAPLGPTMRLAA